MTTVIPHEVQFETSSNADLLRLCLVARITHKYQFRSVEEWVLNTLTNFCNLNYVPRLFTSLSSPLYNPFLLTPRTPQLVQITEVAILCDNAVLRTAATSRWTVVIGNNKDLAIAINTAQRLGISQLPGLAYRAMMLKGGQEWDRDPLLTCAQCIRLLSGHYSLVLLCEVLPLQPPVLAHGTACVWDSEFDTNCKAAWAKLWNELVSGHEDQMPAMQTADVLGRLGIATCLMQNMREGDTPGAEDWTDGMCEDAVDSMPEVTAARLR